MSRINRIQRLGGLCLMPNLNGTYLCGAENGKKICYRILDCRVMGFEVLEVTITWTIREWRSFPSVFTCVRPQECFTHDPENFEMCGVLNSNNGLWATMGPLETVGNRAVVGWRFRMKAVCWNGRFIILYKRVSLPPPIVWHFVLNMQHNWLLVWLVFVADITRSLIG